MARETTAARARTAARSFDALCFLRYRAASHWWLTHHSTAESFTVRHARHLVAVCALLLLPSISSAQELAPADLSAKLLLRALAYDRGLKARASADLVVAVLSRAGDPAQDASGFVEALKGLGNVTVQELPVRVVSFTAATGAEAAAHVGTTKAQVLYVGQGFEGDAAVVQAAAARAQALTTYRAPGYVDAFALGVVPKDGKPKIMIKLAAAKESGADLDAQLLRLAQVR